MFRETDGNQAYAELDRQMKQRYEVYKSMDNRPSASSIASKIIDKMEQDQPSFKNAIGEDAAYMLELRKKMSDMEWETQSPFTKDIRW